MHPYFPRQAGHETCLSHVTPVGITTLVVDLADLVCVYTDFLSNYFGLIVACISYHKAQNCPFLAVNPSSGSKPTNDKLALESLLLSM